HDAGSLIDLNDVVVTNFGGPAGVRFDVHLGHSFTVDLPFALGFTAGGVGLEQLLPGFGLSVSARNAAQLELTWDYRLGFGLNEADLFDVNAAETSDIADPHSAVVPELTTQVHVTLPGLDSPVALGLLDGQVTNGSTPSFLNVTVPLVLIDPNGVGRLTPFEV